MPYKINEFQHLPHVIPDATTVSSGVMSAADKAKLDLIGPSSGTREISTLYVRTTGSDTTGDGSLANPYRTVAYAMTKLVRYADQLYQIIDCTDIGTETLASVLNAPPIISNSHVITDPSPVFGGFVSIAALTLRAVPTTIATIAPGFAVVSAPTTSLATVTVAGAAWTPNEHVGRLFYWNGVGLSVIVANGADTLDVAVAGSFLDNTQNAYIVEQSAELKLGSQEGGSIESTLQLSGTQCGVALCGLKLTRTNPTTGTNQSLTFAQLEDFLAYGCLFEGVDMNSSLATTPLFSGCHFPATDPAHDFFNVVGTGFTAFDCFWDGITATWSVQGGASPGVYVLTSVFDGCSSVGHGTSAQPIVAYKFSQCLIENGAGDGVVYNGGATCVLENCEINGCAGNAISAIAPGRLELTNVIGSGSTGYGVKLVQGAHAVVNVNTVVAGALGDMKVGGKVTRTWADFRTNAPLRNEADFFTAATSDGSVLSQ